jgi:NADH-quinone oxidoreductase subunit L
MDHVDASLRWIPLLPLLAAVVSGMWLIFARRELPRGVVATLACAAPIGSFLIALGAVSRLVSELEPGQRYLLDRVYSWINVHPFHADLALLLDPLSAILVLVVTGVGSLIHVYSIGYMSDDHRDDRGFQRFFVYLNLFTFAMLMLILGDNLLVMFVGWEGVGLCSYLLIGFWYSDDHNAMCGQKAFVVNRIGDFGFLLGVFLLFWAFYDASNPTIEFREMADGIDRIADRTVQLPAWLSFLPGFPTWKLLTLAGLCLFVGACGKSAQIPLYVWLPDAMAGPTPVSALIHAATMVTAGVYMICRMSFMYAYAPGALATAAWVGGITALVAGVIATCQRDIKKVLAYSTVSQLGYMVMAAGVAAYSAGVFHLVTHAWFKALLFLGAGSVILGMHHEQDIFKMGGLSRRMRITHWTFLAGVLAISGVPPTSGFFSKDEILLSTFLAHELPGHAALYAIGVTTAALTAFYMWRLYFLVFTGENRSDYQVQRHIEEQPAVITGPLVVLALFALFGGFLSLPDVYGEHVLGIERSNTIHHFLEPLVGGAAHEASVGTEFLLMLVAVGAAALGFLIAWVFYWARRDLPDKLMGVFAPLHRAVAAQLGVDALYDRVIVKPLVFLSDRILYRIIDAKLIDGLAVNGTAISVREFGDRFLKRIQTGSAQSYVFGMLVGCVAVLAYLIRQG